mmetsp:Transcript_85857/g.246408  ORF Transcript_85857/g.246408 Transcript_85857/m.246408 type:complete len:80 (+) Transcript_85857:445-684(+)
MRRLLAASLLMLGKPSEEATAPRLASFARLGLVPASAASAASLAASAAATAVAAAALAAFAACRPEAEVDMQMPDRRLC